MRRWLASAVVAWWTLSSASVSAQIACAIQSQGALLNQFSDNAAPGSIAPAAVRNVICSSQLLTSAGGLAVPQALISSPTILFPTTSGTVMISSGAVAVSRNGGVTFYSVSLTGGAIPVMAFDQVQITWFSAVVPTVTFFPNGNQ